MAWNRLKSKDEIDGLAKAGTIMDLIRYRSRIEEKEEVLIPDIRWDGTRRKSQFLNGERGEGQGR